MYRHTLIIVLACAAISAPAFAQSDLPKCPDGLGPRNRPDCRYLNPPTRPWERQTDEQKKREDNCLLNPFSQPRGRKDCPPY
jgi:hypothetical protein